MLLDLQGHCREKSVSTFYLVCVDQRPSNAVAVVRKE